MVSALILFNYSVCVLPLKSCFCLMYLLPMVLTHKYMLLFWHVHASAYQNSWNCYTKWPSSSCTVCTVLSSVILHRASSCTTADIQQPEPTIIASSQAVWDDFGAGMLMLELLFAQIKSVCFSMHYDLHVENTDTFWITCVQQRYSNQLTIKMRWYFCIQPTQALAVLHRGLRWYLIHWCFL